MRTKPEAPIRSHERINAKSKTDSTLRQDGQPPEVERPSGGWLHRDILITLVEAAFICLLAALPRDCAFCWILALTVFLITCCEVAPHVHPNPLFHLVAGIDAGYITLITAFFVKNHLFHMLV